MNCWRCQKCSNTSRRLGNDNTPVRKLNLSMHDETNMSVDDLICEDRSILGETPVISPLSQANEYIGKAETITLAQFSKLLDTKLDEKLENNKQSILLEIQSTVQTEITRAISDFRKEITQNTEVLKSDQKIFKDDLSKVTERIKRLELENNKLKNEIQDLKNTSNYLKQTDSTENTKKIVIYGLTENYGETEFDLEKRIEFALMDILGVNLTGYIENISRIGRRGPRRPVQVELISKKMTRHILSNCRYFKSTGLFVTEYLDGQALQNRKQQRSQLHQKGQDTLKNATSGNQSINYRSSMTQTTSNITLDRKIQQNLPYNNELIDETFRS